MPLAPFLRYIVSRLASWSHACRNKNCYGLCRLQHIANLHFPSHIHYGVKVLFAIVRLRPDGHSACRRYDNIGLWGKFGNSPLARQVRLVKSLWLEGVAQISSCVSMLSSFSAESRNWNCPFIAVEMAPVSSETTITTQSPSCDIPIAAR